MWNWLGKAGQWVGLARKKRTEGAQRLAEEVAAHIPLEGAPLPSPSSWSQCWQTLQAWAHYCWYDQRIRLMGFVTMSSLALYKGLRWLSTRTTPPVVVQPTSSLQRPQKPRIRRKASSEAFTEWQAGQLVFCTVGVMGMLYLLRPRTPRQP